ncbi:MAG: hypothetical protein KDA61_17190, partial [Planctomycetales bacterium]|nr:hypothetical protein [Planctomycetales bacterium]
TGDSPQFVDAQVVSIAVGGASGRSATSGAFLNAGGNATASAEAFGYQQAGVSAQAVGGKGVVGGSAVATASGDALSGQLRAEASSLSNAVVMRPTAVTQPNGLAEVYANSQVGGATPLPATIATMRPAASWGAIAPDGASVDATLETNPQVHSFLNLDGSQTKPQGEALGMATLAVGVALEDGASTGAATAYVDITLDLTQVAVDHLVVGLVNPMQSGAANGQATLWIEIDGAPLVFETFASLPDLVAFSSDRPIDLGNCWSGTIDLRVGMSVEDALPGASLATQLLVATSAAVDWQPPSADFSDDGVIDAADLAAWERNFGALCDAPHANGDADWNGVVDGVDFLLWQRTHGATVPAIAGQQVPEPSSVWAALAGLFALGRRMRTSSKRPGIL